MTWQYTPYSLLMAFSGVSCLLTALVAARRLKSPGSMSLILAMLATAELTFSYAFEFLVVGEAAKIIMSKIEYIGLVGLPVFFLSFALEYTRQDKWFAKKWKIVLWIIPLLTLLFAFTNELHHLIWTSFTPAPGNMLVYGHGPWFWLNAGYSHLLVMTGTIALLRAVVQYPGKYRNQLFVIALASVLPWVGSILYLVGISPPGVDLMPVAMTLTGILLTYGMLRYQIFDVVPIAHYMLIENINDGILVLDGNHRILDINPAAETMLGMKHDTAVGRSVDMTQPPWERLLKPNPGNKSSHYEVETGFGKSRQYLDVSISPILDHNKKNAGMLAVLRDNTSHRLTEDALANRNEELKIVNQISLTITSGLEMEQVIKTLHEQCSQVAPCDIFYVAIYNESTSIAHIPIYYERGRYQSGPSRDLRDRPGILGTVISERRTIYLKDNLKPETRPLQPLNTLRERQARSYLGIPLLLRDRVIGVLSIQSYHADAYSPDTIRILERIAVQAAIAIENARLYAEVQRMAIIDELTGIYNYRGLVELGARELERSRRFNRPLSVLFFDVDDFRDFNNRYSHAIGNLILKNAVTCCRSVLRSVDVLTRFGGDEFVALLPETSLENAAAVAQRLVDVFADSRVDTSHGPLKATISVGVAELTDATPDLFSLIDNANRAEHEAKKHQKGIVAIAR